VVSRLEVRTQLEVLEREECDQLLAHHHIGRLAIVVGGQPLVFPVNYALCDGAIVFRTARGTKLFGAVGHPVAFEIDGVDASYHEGWSVLAVGEAEDVRDAIDLARLENEPLPAWSEAPKDHYVRIRPRAVTGRRIPPHPTSARRPEEPDR
jgi:nitroimidazol reductase NimA-like FMN-containing flavoprotein (pyridoxamine 5'-phosphate oxidase superfamily)